MTRVTDIPTLSGADHLVGVRDGSVGPVATDTLAAQLIGSGPLADEIAAVRGQVVSGLLAPATWAALSAITGSGDAAGAEVPLGDDGTHPQATATGYDGDTVQNAGRYSWSAAWSRWVRVAEYGAAAADVILSASGTGDAITAVSDRDYAKAPFGAKFVLPVAAANTGAVTVQIDGGTARALVTNTGAALIGGELTSGQVVEFRWDGTQYRLIPGASIPAMVQRAETARDEAAQHASDASEDAAAAALSEANAAGSATVAGVQAGISTAQATAAAADAALAGLAALAAGAPLVTSLTDPVPADGSIEILKVPQATQVWEVQGGVWVALGWLGEILYDTVAQMLADDSVYPAGTILRDRARGCTYRAVATGGQIRMDGGAGQRLDIVGTLWTPHHWGAVESTDAVKVDATTQLQALFTAFGSAPKGVVCDWRGHWAISAMLVVDHLNNGTPRNYFVGKLDLIGSPTLDAMLYIKYAHGSRWFGRVDIMGAGGTDYSTRTVTDGVVVGNVASATFDGFRIWNFKRHGVATGGLYGDPRSHICCDFGFIDARDCGSAISHDVPLATYTKNFSFTARTDTGGGTSFNQRSVLTIDGGTDVLQVGGTIKFAGFYHVIETLDAGAGTISVYPCLHSLDATGDFASAHGAVFRGYTSDSASVLIEGIKAMRTGVGLLNDCLYGPTVLRLETQVVGVSYAQRGECLGTVIELFHPETPEGDVDILKCDANDTRTTILGTSVSRVSDMISLFPFDPNTGNETTGVMQGISVNIDNQMVNSGQGTPPAKQTTGGTFANSLDADPIVIRNRNTVSLKLERNTGIAATFGRTSVTFIRMGDSTNVVPGSTTLVPTTGDLAAGVTINGASSLVIPAKVAGTIIDCQLDVPRNNWEVYVRPPAPVTTPAAPAAPVGGATVDTEARATLALLRTALITAGVIK